MRVCRYRALHWKSAERAAGTDEYEMLVYPESVNIARLITCPAFKDWMAHPARAETRSDREKWRALFLGQAKAKDAGLRDGSKARSEDFPVAESSGWPKVFASHATTMQPRTLTHESVWLPRVPIM
jgi:hypothetical protein